MKLILAIAVAFSLIARPGAASATAMPDCAMAGQQMAKPDSHAKTDRCALACPVSTVAVLLPGPTETAVPLTTHALPHDRATVRELASFTASGLDPPPRLRS